jgi:hypothetical protein
VVPALLSLAAGLAVPHPAVATAGAAANTGLQVVASVPYANGSHLEHATIDNRDYLFAATQTTSGVAQLRVIDVTTPEAPEVVATLACGKFQGNLQVSADGRTLILGVDGPAISPRCYSGSREGFVTIDITDPTHPTPIGFADIPGGSHSTAAHPTKPLVYNAPEGSPVPDRGTTPELEVWSIQDPSQPVLLNTVSLPGVHSPHDISFNADGTMAASANITSFHLLDTADAVNPKVLTTTQCPGCVHAHEARFTPDSRRLIVNDEFFGGPNPCPGGHLYFYDITGSGDDRDVSLHGTYTIDDTVTEPTHSTQFCTPHVFDISADGTTLATSWHAAGVRLLDITKTQGVTVGAQQRVGDGARQIGSYATPSGDWFTAKMYKGPYVYAVNQTSGLEIFRITP